MNVYLCVCVCVCVPARARAAATVGHQPLWTSISFLPTTEINRPPSFISKQCLGFRPKCVLPALLRPPPPHVSLGREARITAPQAGFPLFSPAVTGGFPGLLSPPPPQPPLSQSRSSPPPPPLRQLAARAPPLPAAQPRLLGPGGATKPGARGGAARAYACRRAYTRNQQSSASGTRARAARVGRASPSRRTNALASLVPTRSGRGRRDLTESEALSHWSEGDGWGGEGSKLGCAFA